MVANNLRPIILTFIVIMMGIPFLIAIANSNAVVTNSQPINNETLNFAQSRIGGSQGAGINSTVSYLVANNPNNASRASNISIQSVTVANATGALAVSNTDYIINTSLGQITLLNTTFWTAFSNNSNTSLVSYNYFTNNYVNGAPNAMFALIPFLSALGLLLGVIGYQNWDKIKELVGY